MKKFLTLLFVMMLIMTTFTACGSGNEGGAAGGSVEGTPAEIFDTPKSDRLQQFLAKVL